VQQPTSTLRPYQPGWWLQRLILGYRRLVSPALGRHCRYLPSCSEYAFEAVDTHGAFKGTWLAVRRVGRCHPFREGGYDPVPPRRTSREGSTS
jgi:putative membrane protein insertion efficiency factor